MTKASSFLLRVLLPLAFPEELFPTAEMAAPTLVFPPTDFPDGLGALGATSSQKPTTPFETKSTVRNLNYFYRSKDVIFKIVKTRYGSNS
jgi:hypothetical protein